MRTRILTLLVVIIAAQAGMAQNSEKKSSPQKFSPQKFQADLEAFITREANLTESEAAAYFPLLREMHEKQRALYQQTRQHEHPSGDEACAAAIRKGDIDQVEGKKLEQRYHEKMLKKLPASKVYAAIRAEGRFHRNMMRGWQGMGMQGMPGWRGPKGNWKDRHR